MSKNITFMQKLIAGDPYRRTRLHDEKGNFVDAEEWRHFPKVLQRFIFRKFFGRMNEEPWWTFTVKERIEDILKPNMAAVEFGSGYSTLWLANRVDRLLSIEHDPIWWNKINKKLELKRQKNTEIRLLDEENYTNINDIDDKSIDLCVIDGILRGACAKFMLSKMKPGGWVYLDNSDKDMGLPVDAANVRGAEAVLLNAANVTNVTYFTGFSIGSLNVHQGMLCKISDH